MALGTEQLRTALHDLDGTRDVRLEFDGGDPCLIAKALLVPAEPDGIVKLTDGAREYLVDADRVAWIEIGPRLFHA